MVKKALTWGSIAFLIFFIAFRPRDAAGVVKALFGTLAGAANGIGEFFATLFS